MGFEIEQISERIAYNYAKKIDEWLKPLIGEYFPIDYDWRDWATENNITRQRIIEAIAENNLYLEYQHQNHTFWGKIYRLKKGDEILSELKLETILK